MTTIIDLPLFLCTEPNLAKKLSKVHDALLCHERLHFSINRKSMKKGIGRIRFPVDSSDLEKVLSTIDFIPFEPHERLDKKTGHGCKDNRWCSSVDKTFC